MIENTPQIYVDSLNSLLKQQQQKNRRRNHSRVKLNIFSDKNNKKNENIYSQHTGVLNVNSVETKTQVSIFFISTGG